MPSLAITGTIGSGKSLVLRMLGELLGAETFSADEANKRLLHEDTEVKELLLSNFGSGCYLEDGSVDRKFLFNLITKNTKVRGILESILHPRLQILWRPRAERFRTSADSYFLAEIPLLYEKGLELYFDKTIVVGCSDSIRQERLQRLRSLTAAEASAWLSMQASQEMKVSKSHYLLWNDGSEAQLLQQTHLLASHFL
jgi:dephospho-CoA kinase